MSCEQCLQGYVLPGEPSGSIVDGAYLHTAPESSTKSFAVILLTDIFGLPLKNSKIIADELSKRLECDVWIPDMFNGEPPVTVEALEPLVPDLPGQDLGIWKKLQFIWALVTHAPGLIKGRPSVVDARITEFMKKLKGQNKYTKIGAVGYCYGGAVAIRLGPTDLFDSLVIAHPGRTNIDQIKAIKVPSSWACAEEDMSFGPALRNEAEAVFAGRKDKPDFIAYEFKDYKGTCHGFAARPNLGIPHIVEAYNAALDQTVDWFQKTLEQ